MAAKKPKRKTQSSPPPDLFHTFITSIIQSPQGLNPANLKRLYAILVHCSSNECVDCSGFESGASSQDLVLNKSGVKLKLGEIHDLSDVLFKELDFRFSRSFSALHYASACHAGGRPVLDMDVLDKIQELTLLLRCCMVALIPIAFDQNLLTEKGRVLLSILTRLTSIDLSHGNGKRSVTFEKLVSRECAYVRGDCTASVSEEIVASICLSEPSDPCYTFLCTVLEVFADELSVHKLVREYLMLIDSASSRGKMLFSCHFGHGNIGSVLKVICAHFMVSVSDEQAFENFLHRLFWCHGEDFRIPEISLPAALSLLQNSVMFSAPKMFQAYLILLVSEAIGIRMPSENMKSDSRHMGCYLMALERSVIFYTRHMSNLHSHPPGDNESFVESCFLGCCQLTFESFLQPATRDKLAHVIAKSSSSWKSCASNVFITTKSDLMAASITYVNESICIFEDSYKDEILSILSNMILKCASHDISDSALHRMGETSQDSLYLLASILKLMSSSMLQAIWFMETRGFAGSLKSSDGVSSSKEYDALVDIISCFQRFCSRLPIQKFSEEVMQSYPGTRNNSKWMLLHFSDLLSLSYASGVDFLIKNCLFTVMILLKLFIVEGGDLSAVGALFSSASEYFSSGSPSNVEQTLVVRKCSQVVSSKIQKIQEIYLSLRLPNINLILRVYPFLVLWKLLLFRKSMFSRTLALVCSHGSKEGNWSENSDYVAVLNGKDSAVSIAEDSTETSNSEIFLKCILGGKSQNSSDIDDLEDFIECVPGKDYLNWLRGRQRFRLWKNQKTALLRWKKKKRAWKIMKRR